MGYCGLVCETCAIYLATRQEYLTCRRDAKAFETTGGGSGPARRRCARHSVRTRAEVPGPAARDPVGRALHVVSDFYCNLPRETL